MDAIARRILLIEDNHDLREEIVNILELEGYMVDTAENGRIGLERLAKNGCPDVVVCDLMMPDMGGYETLQAIRGNPSTATLPFLLLTAREDQESANRGIELGADDYITKPFRIDDLRKAIETVLNKRAFEADATRPRRIDPGAR